MPRRTIRVSLTLTAEDADARTIRAVAEEDFGVARATEKPLADVLACIVRNTLEAHVAGFAVPITITDVTAGEVEGGDARPARPEVLP